MQLQVLMRIQVWIQLRVQVGVDASAGQVRVSVRMPTDADTHADVETGSGLEYPGGCQCRFVSRIGGGGGEYATSRCEHRLRR